MWPHCYLSKSFTATPLFIPPVAWDKHVQPSIDFQLPSRAILPLYSTTDADPHCQRKRYGLLIPRKYDSESGQNDVCMNKGQIFTAPRSTRRKSTFACAGKEEGCEITAIPSLYHTLDSAVISRYFSREKFPPHSNRGTLHMSFTASQAYLLTCTWSIDWAILYEVDDMGDLQRGR